MTLHPKVMWSRIAWLAFGLLLLVLLFSQLGLSGVLKALGRSPWYTVGLLATLQGLGLLLSALALRAFLPDQGWRQLLEDVSRSALVSFVGIVAAGEGGLLFFLMQRGTTLTVASRAILLDRLVTVMTILASALFVAGRLFWLPPHLSLGIAIALTCAVFAGLAILPSDTRRPLLINLAYSLLRIAVWGLFYLVAFRSVGAQTGDLLDFSLIPVALRLFGVIPIPGGLGVTEISAAWLFAQIGIAADLTIAALVLDRLGTLCGTALVSWMAALGACPSVTTRQVWEDRAAVFSDQGALPEIPSDCLDALRCRVIVDLGCGFGAALPLLRTRASHIVAIDRSLALLSRVPVDAGVWRVQADACRLPLRSGQVDAIFSSLLFPCIAPDDEKAAWAEASRLLQPGGRFLLILANRLSFYYPLRVIAQVSGLYTYQWCYHGDALSAQRQGERYGLSCKRRAGLAKPPTGGSVWRLACARSAAWLDSRIARFHSGWGGDLMLLFVKKDSAADR